MQSLSSILIACVLVCLLSESKGNDNHPALLEGLKKTKVAENWDKHGPWIVELEYGYNDQFIEEAHAKYRKKYSDLDLKDYNRYMPFNVKHSFKDNNGLNGVVIEGLEEDEIKKIKGFKFIQPDLPVSINADSWGLHRIGKPTRDLVSPYVPAFKGCGVDVYVVDTGIDTAHVEFSPISGVNRQVTNIYNVYGSVTGNTDGNGHGTHCAGTVGGNTVGVATCSNLYGLKVLSNAGSGSTSGIIAALSVIKARHISSPGKKTVVSMSLGGGCAYVGCTGDSMIAKIDEMVAVGIVFAVAAGNSATTADTSSPAAARKAFTVAASTSTDALASYSNYGNLIDIIAPGSAINSACAINTNGCTNEASYLSISGTSMATPHVAGVIAQNLEKVGGYLSMTTESDVVLVSDALKYDGVLNVIALTSSAIGAGTVNSLLQTPPNNNIFAGINLMVPTKLSTIAPTRPTAVTTTTPTSGIAYGDGCKSGTVQYRCNAGNYCQSLYCYSCPANTFCPDGIFSYFCPSGLYAPIGSRSCLSNNPTIMPISSNPSVITTITPSFKPSVITTTTPSSISTESSTTTSSFGPTVVTTTTTLSNPTTIPSFKPSVSATKTPSSVPTGRSIVPSFSLSAIPTNKPVIASTTSPTSGIAYGDGCKLGSVQYGCSAGRYCQSLFCYFCPANTFCPNGIYSYFCPAGNYASIGSTSCSSPRPSGNPTAKTTIVPSVVATKTPSSVPTVSATNPSFSLSAIPTNKPVISSTTSPTSGIAYGDGCKLGTVQYRCNAGNYCRSLFCYICPANTFCPDGIFSYFCPIEHYASIGSRSCSTAKPSARPSIKPTMIPTTKSSVKPSFRPSIKPTKSTPTKSSVKPSLKPSTRPSRIPTLKPSLRPTLSPTTRTPSFNPSEVPTETPSEVPTETPSEVPTETPSEVPTEEPTI